MTRIRGYTGSIYSGQFKADIEDQYVGWEIYEDITTDSYVKFGDTVASGIAENEDEALTDMLEAMLLFPCDMPRDSLGALEKIARTHTITIKPFDRGVFVMQADNGKGGFVSVPYPTLEQCIEHMSELINLYA